MSRNLALIAIALIVMFSSGCTALGIKPDQPAAAPAATQTPAPTATPAPAAAAPAAQNCWLWWCSPAAAPAAQPAAASPAPAAAQTIPCPLAGGTVQLDPQACANQLQAAAKPTIPTPATAAATPGTLPLTGLPQIPCAVAGGVQMDVSKCLEIYQAQQQAQAAAPAPAAAKPQAPAQGAQPGGLTAAAAALGLTPPQQQVVPLMPQPAGPGISFTDEHDDRCPKNAQLMANMVSGGQGSWRYFGPNASHLFGKWIGSFSPAVNLVGLEALFGSYDNHDFVGYTGPIFNADGVTFNCRVRR